MRLPSWPARPFSRTLIGTMALSLTGGLARAYFIEMEWTGLEQATSLSATAGAGREHAAGGPGD
jgi:hypothetical protein